MGELSNAIDAAYDEEAQSTYRSSRIGASIIGNPCEAYLAFAVRGFPEGKIDSGLKRIFRDGHTLEKAVLKDLLKAGVNVQEIDPMTGKQYCWSTHEGHVVFYADGIINTPEHTPRLLEIKSMNDANWKKFSGRGIQVSHPKYYSQLQLGMGLSGIHSSVIIGYNKNTSEYHDQIVEFDVLYFKNLIYKAERVLRGQATKVSKDETDWRCRDCPKFAVCWKGAPVVQDMRTCAHAYPSHGGTFACSKGCSITCADYKRYEPLEKP